MRQTDIKMIYRHTMQYKLKKVFLLISIGFFFLNCGAMDPAVKHGATLIDYQGLMLPAKYGRGAERLKIESDYDCTIEKFVYENGEPDYIYVEGLRTVKIFYFNTNEVVTFKRPILNSNSKVHIDNCIPDQFIERIKSTQERRGVQSFTFPKDIGC